MAKTKSLSQQKKEISGHTKLIADTFHSAGHSVAVLDASAKTLKTVKQPGLESWYRSYAKRVGELLTHDHSDAALIRSQLNSIESIIGLRR